MKEWLLLSVIFLLLISIKSVLASPFINEINITPSKNLWINQEDSQITVNCNDNDTNRTINDVTLTINTSSSVQFLELDKGNPPFWYKSLSTYLNNVGSYDLIVTCKNDNGENAINTTTILVSKLDLSISALANPAYKSESMSINLELKKNDSMIPYSITDPGSNPKFYLSIDSNQLSLITQGITWNPITGLWTITIDTPTDKLGMRNLNVLASFNGANSSDSIPFSVKNPFELVSVSSSEVQPNDIVTINLLSIKPLTVQDLDINVDNNIIDSSDIAVSRSGNTYSYSVTVTMPNLSPGIHSLLISSDLYSYSLQQDIGYILPVTGKFVDLSNKGINVVMSFLDDNNVEKERVTTDGSGSYSGVIIPDNYTIQLTFPQSTLYLYNVSVSSFNDPIKYYFIDSDVEGIKSAGIFVYEVALPFTNAKIVMSYDEGKVINENNLVVYKCSQFNSVNKICNTNWIEQSPTVDTVANTVTVDTDSLSAYVIGTKKSLYMDYSSEKQIFNLKELVKIRGVVRDESGNFVSNALVSASVDTTDIQASTSSDANGVFYFEFFSPEQEGVYTLSVFATKTPYLDYNKTWTFQVAKNRDLSIVAPDTIRVRKGDNQSVEFSVANIGQTDLSNITISLTGLPSQYYSLSNNIEELKVGEELKIPIVFSIPKDASESTSSITLTVSSDEITKDANIGFTITSENLTSQSPNTQGTSAFSFPSANIVLPISSSDIAYLSIFGVICIFVAYFAKKRKVGGVKERENIKYLLSDIKREIKRKKSVEPIQSFNQIIDKLSEEKKDLK